MSQNGTHDQSRRTFLKAAGGAAAAVSLAGCLGGSGGNGGGGNGGGSKNLSGTLIYARGAPSPTLDPHNTTSGEVAKVTNQLYDKLIQFVPGKNKLEAGLATKYELKGTTATLTLREGIKFQNGEEFTAQDFKATYRRFTDSSYKYYPGKKYISAYGPIALGNWVKSVTAKDKYRLEIELKRKYAPFLRNLAMFCCAVLSEKAIKEKTTIKKEDGKKKVKTTLNKEPVGTGPFKLGQYESNGQRILLAGNKKYWGDGPKLAKIVFNAIDSNSTRAQTLISGEADIIDGLGTSSSQQVKEASGVSLKSFEGMNVGYMAFNMARYEPFRKKKVRHALSYAVNTEVIVNNIFKGIAEQASQPIPSNVLGYNEKLSPYPYNPKKAKQLLKEAGHGDGLKFELATFKNPRGYNPSPVRAAQQVRSDLAKVGVEVTINQMAFKPFLNYTSAGKHDACFLGWYSDNGDPDNFYYSLLHPGVKEKKIPKGQDWVSFDTKGYNTLNVAAWANREFMDITEKAQVTYDKAKRKELYQKAGKISHEEAPWVFIDHAKGLRGVGKAVSDYTPAAVGGPYLNLVTVNK
jgi:peptide/nickel transport system substrate-binding protein